jgi:predicted ATPase/DNA-binding SARP family transcriptional activator
MRGPMSRCEVLGAVRVFDSGGQRLILASQEQRRLLAMLCLHAHTTVRSVVLEEHLGLSSGALRTSVSRLRRVIGAETLVSESAGYELRASVDAVEYGRLVNEAFLSDAERARFCLEQAGALWDGPAYEEFAHEPWAEIEARRLGELHSAAVEELVLLLLEGGEPAAAIATVFPLIDQQPYRDLPRALLMRALDQAGRRTDALRQFQSYRLVLQGEIGTEPSAPLVELDRAIASAADLEQLRRSGHPAWTRRRGLLTGVAATKRPAVPNPLSSFVGRAQEMAELGALLKNHRIVTLTGSGGCGKSRLAMRIASTARERDGTDAWWVDLGVLDPTANVAEQIATEIGVVPRHDVIAELERRLRGKRSLLVLDNAEHVLDATAAVLAALLTRCPETSALITSRQPLGLAGEVVWRVPELTMPEDSSTVTLDNFDRHDALRLFLVRAREARPGMVVDRQAVGYIASICRELDGMPLALELAAARLRSVPLPTLAAGIAEIIRWGVGDRAKPARQATLRASIEWSFGLISSFEQRVLVCLATFHSPFDIEAAAAVIAAVDGDDNGSAEDRAITGDHLGRLTDVGLLQLDDGSGRYRMLNTVRQFCTELGRATGDLDRAEEAHARYFARWCGMVGEGRLGIEHHPFVRRMPDVVAASSWARSHDDRETVFAICRGLAPVRSALGHQADFVATWSWLQAIDRAERTAPWAEATAALLATATSQVYETASVVGEILVHVGSGSGRASAWLERGRAMVPAYRGQPAAIHAYAEGLLARGDDLEASVYVGFAAYMQALMGRLDRCDPLLDQLRRLTRRHGCTFSVDSVGNGYAAAVVAETIRGDLGSALDRSKRPVPIDPAFSLTSAAALAHAALLAADHDTMSRALEWSTHGSFPLLAFLTPFVGCCAALLHGDAADAAELAEEFSDQITVPVWQVYALPVINAALIAVGRITEAQVITDAAGSLVAEMETAPQLSASIHVGCAQVLLAQDELHEAEQQALAALEVAHVDDLPIAVVDALDLMAVVSERRGLASTTSIGKAAAAERRRLSYQFRIVPAPVAAEFGEGGGHLDVSEVITALVGRQQSR